MWSGLTTNEEAKRSNLRNFIKKTIRFYERWYERFDSQGKMMEQPDEKICQKFGCKGTESKKEVNKLLAIAK